MSFNYIGQTFQRFDFGSTENQKRYGQSSPPAYELSKITCPVYIFWGQNDKVLKFGIIQFCFNRAKVIYLFPPGCRSRSMFAADQHFLFLILIDYT